MKTTRYRLTIALLFLCGLAAITLTLASEPQEDFTDTGVGCIDDCLEPLIEDEAQTETSTQREEN